jgi:single-strand DNA-binding protein
MASINKCFFIGNITKDPVLTYMPNGDAVANISIACNEQWKNKAGEKQESVEFVNLVFFRKLAEIVGEYCKKGASIHVEGRMKTEKYDKDGSTRYSTKIIVDSMQMLGSKQTSSGSRPEPSRQAPRQAPASKPAPAPAQGKHAFDNFDDDIAF